MITLLVHYAIFMVPVVCVIACVITVARDEL